VVPIPFYWRTRASQDRRTSENGQHPTSWANTNGRANRPRPGRCACSGLLEYANNAEPAAKSRSLAAWRAARAVVSESNPWRSADATDAAASVQHGRRTGDPGAAFADQQ